MKNVLTLLSCFLNIGLVSSCAFAMGKVRCEAPDLPVRPQFGICIANGSGGAGCYDPRRVPSQYNRESILNFVCTDSFSNQMNEEWIEQVLKSCGK